MTSCSIELGDGVMENVSSGGVRRFSGLNLLVIENEFAVSHRGDDVAGVVWHGQFIVDLTDATFPLGDPLAGDLVLNPHQSLEQAFGSRRAAGHVDVDEHNEVDALDHMVAHLKYGPPPVVQAPMAITYFGSGMRL